MHTSRYRRIAAAFSHYRGNTAVFSRYSSPCHSLLVNSCDRDGLFADETTARSSHNGRFDNLCATESCVHCQVTLRTVTMKSICEVSFFSSTCNKICNANGKMVNGSRYYRALESVSVASAYSALTIYTCQIWVHQTLTVLNSNFLQLGRRSGGRPQRTVYPRRLPVNTVIHTTLAGIEPTTFRLLVRGAIPVSYPIQWQRCTD